MRERIGIQHQESHLPDRMKVWEAMILFSSFYERRVDWEVLLECVELTEKQNAYYASFSSGQK